jgi:hypothetical protein
MTNEETAWVAGILEGEGCFDANANRRSPRVRVEMTDQDIVLRLHRMLGGSVHYPTNRHPDRWKDTARWTLGKRSEAEPVFRAIRPWLSERRGAKVDELLAIWDRLDEE